MADSRRKDRSWSDPSDKGKQGYRQLRRDALSNVFTILLTAVIIVGGIMLPSLVYPYIDSYEGLTRLEAPDSVVSGHVFEQPVALYPWNIYNEAQLTSLAPYERETLEQSGVASLLVSNMHLRGMTLPLDDASHISQILDDFRRLEPPVSSEQDAPALSEPGCYVLMDEDINKDGRPDVRCAVDFGGNLISLIFVASNWDTIQLTAPIAVSTAASEAEAAEAEATEDAEGSDTEGKTEDASTGDPATPPDESAENYTPQVARPSLPEEENIWSFSYVLSREALNIGQEEIYSAFRQLELSYEERYHYPYIDLVVAPSEEDELLPEIDLSNTMTTRPELAIENYLLRIYDISNGTRLVLYINSNTRYCDGFVFSAIPQ